MSSVRALRGATTIDTDEADQVRQRTIALLQEMCSRNGVELDAVISVLFTVTADIRSAFPASAAREIGFSDVPLIGAQEQDVEGALPLCIRVLMHIETDRARSELKHAYLEGAVALRNDLAD